MSDAMSLPNTMILGQGVTDFKGIWGTTTGLKEIYPNRVVETPLSEDTIAGVCLGASLNGAYPINTHIRADFGLLIFNQLINLAAKYRYMFGGLFSVPSMFRFVVGRSWGQGAQHSQSLQSLLAHIPGLVVLMPANPSAILASYKHAIAKHKGPVVMFEHRLLYELDFDEIPSYYDDPFGSHVILSGDDVTIVATSVMVLEAKRAADYLKKNGINVELIDLHSISHPNKDLIFNSVKKTGRLIVADTSWIGYGVCAEVCRLIVERDPSVLIEPVKMLGMQPAPCPTAKFLEDAYYPDVHDITKTVIELMSSSEGSFDNISIPNKQSMTDYYKHFKGPF